MKIIAQTSLITKFFENEDECCKYFKLNPVKLTEALKNGNSVQIGIRNWTFDEWEGDIPKTNYTEVVKNL